MNGTSLPDRKQATRESEFACDSDKRVWVQQKFPPKKKTNFHHLYLVLTYLGQVKSLKEHSNT